MKVLFIGGTGNISTSVSRLALQRGMDLWLLNRRGRAPDVPRAQIIQGDINNETQIEALLHGHQWDLVVDWVAFTEQDVERDIRLFDGKTRHYIYISSASCYQKPSLNPVITETTPLENPYWDYSRHKIAGEMALMRAVREQGFPGTIVRPSHTYSTVIPIPLGGWTEYTTVTRIKEGQPIVVHGDGSSLWTLTHADDFAVGLLGLAGKTAALGEAFHITSDESLSWDTIHRLLSAAVGREPHIVHVTSDRICQLRPDYTGTLLGDKSVSVIFDNSKIKRLVPEFEARISFAEGIKRTIDWFEADPARQVLDPATNSFIEELVATA